MGLAEAPSTTGSARLARLAARLQWLRPRPWPRRRLRFTREGWYYCAFALGVGAAALNTGNNLLFLVLGLQLTLIVLSGVLSESALRELEVVRLPAPDPTSGDCFQLTYLVRNRKRFWPSYALEIFERASPFSAARAVVFQVAPRGEATASLALQAPARGRYALDQIEVATRFPFGLFEKSIRLDLPGELFVLPVRVPPGEPQAQGGYRDGARPEGRAGRGGEFFGLRELRTGEDRRLIHWRKSASAGRWLVVEREREQRRRVVILLDNRGLRDPGWLEGPVKRAAAAARLLSQRGLSVGLSTAGTYLPPGDGTPALRTLLRQLAIVAPAPPSAPAPNAHGEGTLPIQGGTP